MPKKYSNQETIAELNSKLGNINELYNAGCVNWKGKTYEEMWYSEIIANELLRNLKEFDKISTTTRDATYCRENHQKIEIDLQSNRSEEIFAKRITGLTFDNIGQVLDYQVPLKNTEQDSGIGKIDMISYNKKNRTLFLIELKYKNNSETLLRTILESYTYYKIIDKDKLRADCIASKQFDFNEENIQNIRIVPAVLLVPECQASYELEQVENGERAKLQALILALDIKIFTMDINYVTPAIFQNDFLS